MSNSTVKILPALMVAITSALATLPTFAQAAVNELVITEFSDTSLTATYNGSTLGVTVTPFNNMTDAWTVTFPNTVTFNGVGFDYGEPENNNSSSPVNIVIFGEGAINPFQTAFISSDQINSKFTFEPNGATVTDVGSDSSNNETIDATFTDISDVPEPATWALPCLITGLIAVHFLRGVCSKKTAKSQSVAATPATHRAREAMCTAM